MVKTQEKKKDQKEKNETKQKKMEGKGQFYLLNLFA